MFYATSALISHKQSYSVLPGETAVTSEQILPCFGGLLHGSALLSPFSANETQKSAFIIVNTIMLRLPSANETGRLFWTVNQICCSLVITPGTQRLMYSYISKNNAAAGTGRNKYYSAVAKANTEQTVCRLVWPSFSRWDQWLRISASLILFCTPPLCQKGLRIGACL